jgi:hypothetical protein
MLSRFEVFEQLAAGYVAAHPVTASVLGEVHVTPQPSRLQSAPVGADGVGHPGPPHPYRRTDAADLVRIGWFRRSSRAPPQAAKAEIDR